MSLARRRLNMLKVLVLSLALAMVSAPAPAQTGATTNSIGLMTPTIVRGEIAVSGRFTLAPGCTVCGVILMVTPSFGGERDLVAVVDAGRGTFSAMLPLRKGRYDDQAMLIVKDSRG